jgi:7-cyano-7-deazaguanine synthase in queuosine biosynthesis
MTAFHLRTAREQPLPPHGTLLDWFAGRDRQRSTVQASAGFLEGLAPSAPALDLFHLAGAVYCIDKVTLRSTASDAWTRELVLDAPVTTRPRWRSARPALTEALEFLSGDGWRLRFRSGGDRARSETEAAPPDAVCLFSGGLDSLAGAIDLLEEGRTVLLVGHFESPFIARVQKTVSERLKTMYGVRVALRQLQLGPAASNRLQARPLPDDREITTRARSFLFIGAGLAVASAFGDDVPLYMPENGFIGINAPLVGARAGSLSTRTTHPHFIERLDDARMTVGIANTLKNPYRLQTKGEALAASRNRKLLASLADASVSCAHPEAGRWQRRAEPNCGYCYPCLIRRAALHHVGLDNGASFRYDALTDRELLDASSPRGADLRALVRGLARKPHPNDILRNGRVPGTAVDAFFDVYRRGHAELATWVDTGAGKELRAALAAARKAA